MKLKCLLVPFKSKLFTKPCTKLPQIFKFSFKFKKLICIRALTCHRQHRARPTKTVKTTHRKNRIRGFFSIFRRRKRSTTTTTTSSTTSSRRSLLSIFRRRRQGQGRRSTSVVEVEEEIEDELGELRNMTTVEAAAASGPQEKKIFPSPLTPAYVRLISGSDRNKVRGGQNFDDVDDACRSFENYLVEMIVEEGKLADLMDVEELLYCWKNLKCPVFRDMVCRFYGELCRDLFLSVEDDYDVEEKESSIDDHHFK